MYTKKKLREQRNNAEYRATIHFRKLARIETIIRIEEAVHTPAVLILDKIKEVIISDQTN